MDSPRDTRPVETATLLLRGERSEIERAQASVGGVMERLGYPEPARFAVRLALEEALSNAIRHGHKRLTPDVPITLEVRASAREIDLVVEDRGPGFDPGTVPDPTLDENLELPAGRGLLLMRAYMTRVEFNKSGNRVLLHYRVPTGAVNQAKVG